MSLLIPSYTTLFLWCLPALLLFSRAIADATVVLVGLAFLLTSARERSWAWVKQPWFVAVLVFWLYLLTVNLSISVSFDESLKYVLTFIRWPLFAGALAYWLLNTKEKQGEFLKALLLVSAFIVLDTVWQYTFGIDWFGIEKFDVDRLTGPFRSPIPGTMMLRVWFVALFALIIWQHTFTRAKLMNSYFVLLSMGFAFIFITGERMALALYSSAMVVVLVGLFLSYTKARKHLLIGIITIALVLVSMMWLLPETTSRSVVSLIEKLRQFETSDYGLVFNAAWQVWDAHFWLGAGLHTYQMVCTDMGLLVATGMMCTHPHNLYLQLGAETGVVGLCLFVVMLVTIYISALKAAWQTKQWLIVCLSFAVLTVSFWPLTGGIKVFSNWIAALVWLGVGWVLAVSATLQPALSQQTIDQDHQP